MASVLCRSPRVATVAMPIITVDTAIEILSLLADLEELCAEGYVQNFRDGFGVERFHPLDRERR